MLFFQVFAYTKRQQVMSDDNCLDAASPDGPVKLVRCHGMGGNQAWVFNDEVRLRPGSISEKATALLILFAVVRSSAEIFFAARDFHQLVLD